MNMWDEIEEIMVKDNEKTNKVPCWIDLTPNGKTLVVIYPGRHQEEIVEAFIRELGEPEDGGLSEDYPDTLLLLFPHQNLPEPIMDVAESMTTQSLLQYLAAPGS